MADGVKIVVHFKKHEEKSFSLTIGESRISLDEDEVKGLISKLLKAINAKRTTLKVVSK